uniref:Uncharacterized protein n=1 Tax=Eutreptiella gymnastica TaxID=73025 RepID=A0A7S4LEV1_9EUGL
MTFGLASGDQQVAQREAIKVFGAGVKVMSIRHLQRSGMVRPVYDVELKGVPAGWEGSKVPAADTRLRERSWQRVVRATVRQQYRTLGRNALPAVTGCPNPEDTMAVDVEAGDSADADLL